MTQPWLDYENLRALDTRWTPLTDELRDVIEGLVKEAGTWGRVALATGIKKRYLRRLRQRVDYPSGKALKCVSFDVLDRLLTPSEKVYLLQTLPWYTVDELLEKGLWDPVFPFVERRWVR